jgi:hypothetical protein
MSATAKPWYVSFPTKGRKHYRMTETFLIENEAKVFALKILAQGIIPSAETLNPHTPKRRIAPSDVEAWARSEK